MKPTTPCLITQDELGCRMCQTQKITRPPRISTCGHSPVQNGYSKSNRTIGVYKLPSVMKHIYRHRPPSRAISKVRYLYDECQYETPRLKPTIPLITSEKTIHKVNQILGQTRASGGKERIAIKPRLDDPHPKRIRQFNPKRLKVMTGGRRRETSP